MPSVKRIGKYNVCDEALFRKIKCPVCKKTFLVSVSADDWGYSIKKNHHMKMLCSYSCMKKFQEPLLKKDRKKMAKEFWMAGNKEIHDVLMARAI